MNTDSDLPPEIRESIKRYEAIASKQARGAYLAGLRHGMTGMSIDRLPTLSDWRDRMLEKYRTPSWKRSVVYLVPSVRFRPSEIYTGRKAELSALQSGTKSLNVGTHNALQALQEDGAIAKIGDGLYATAIDGEVMAEVYEDSVNRYRPLSTFHPDVARMIGYAIWNWALLEANVINLTILLNADAVKPSEARPRSSMVDDLESAVATALPRLPVHYAERLEDLVNRYRGLLHRRNLLVHPRPQHIEGRNVLEAPSGSGTVILTAESLANMAQEFETTSLEVAALIHDADARRLAKDVEEWPHLLGNLESLDIRAVASNFLRVLMRSLSPLIALAGLRVKNDASSYIQALGQKDVLDIADSTVIARIAGEIEKAAFGDESAGLREKRFVIDEIQRLCHSPGILQNAIVYRAMDRGKIVLEMPRPTAATKSVTVPIMQVDDFTISVAIQPVSAWRPDEVMLFVEGIEPHLDAGPALMTRGSRVLGNEAAVAVVPWLVDELVRE